jgi:hypothetical protein
VITTQSMFPSGTAVFSDCERYRYSLTRKLGPGDRRVLFVMLNPSTATAETNDPTIRRCIGYAKSWCFDVLEVCNLFALRNTDPKALYSHPDPIGPENDGHLVRAARRAELVVCAWGTHGAFQVRGGHVRNILHCVAGVFPHALRVTKDGHPSHPLYLPGDLKPQPWELA